MCVCIVNASAKQSNKNQASKIKRLLEKRNPWLSGRHRRNALLIPSSAVCCFYFFSPSTSVFLNKSTIIFHSGRNDNNVFDRITCPTIGGYFNSICWFFFSYVVVVAFPPPRRWQHTIDNEFNEIVLFIYNFFFNFTSQVVATGWVAYMWTGSDWVRKQMCLPVILLPITLM